MLRNLFGRNKKRGEDKMMTVGRRPSAPAPQPPSKAGTNTPYTRRAVRPSVVTKSSPLRGDSGVSIQTDDFCGGNDYGGYNDTCSNDSTPSSCD